MDFYYVLSQVLVIYVRLKLSTKRPEVTFLFVPRSAILHVLPVSLVTYLQFVLHTMGGAQSTEVPGGGTEGYHVLRVRSQVTLHILSI